MTTSLSIEKRHDLYIAFVYLPDMAWGYENSHVPEDGPEVEVASRKRENPKEYNERRGGGSSDAIVASYG